jgi:hypothetical protein
LKKSIEKRVEELEKRLKPKKKSKPLCVFIRPVGYDGMTDERFEVERKDLEKWHVGAFILPRPGDSFQKTAAEAYAEKKLKELERSDRDRALIIEVVHIEKRGQGPGK